MVIQAWYPLKKIGFKITFADGKVVDNIGGKLPNNGVYYTDSEGQINISGVNGTLVFTEVSSIPVCLIDENRKSQTIAVDPDDHQSLYFYNIPENTRIIEKYLETESGNEPLKGVTFLVTDSSGILSGLGAESFGFWWYKGASGKVKGLLSLMLSLPETWDYTLSGLARISLGERRHPGRRGETGRGTSRAARPPIRPGSSAATSTSYRCTQPPRHLVG